MKHCDDFSDQTQTILSEIEQEAYRRAADGAWPYLVGDLHAWAAELEMFDMHDLADEVRELPEYMEPSFE